MFETIPGGGQGRRLSAVRLNQLLSGTSAETGTMDVRVSGFRVEGSWETVVRHAERVSRALLRALADRDEEATARENRAFGQWEDWRPRKDEQLEEEVAERTAEQASVDEGEGEEEGVTAREDLADAGRKLDEAASDLSEQGIREAADTVGESVGHTARAADTAGRRALRALEENLYRHLVTRISPYYFDNPLLHANIERLGADEFLFEVDVKDDDLKRAVKDELEDMHNDEDRADDQAPS